MTHRFPLRPGSLPSLQRALLALLVAVAGCDSGLAIGPGIGTSHDLGPGGATGPAGQGLPCDVQAVLMANCWSCHGAVPAGAAPQSLATQAELAAMSVAYPGQTMAQRALARMEGQPTPMPPAPAAAVAATDVATFKAWVDSGAPAGNCMPAGPDPLNAAPTCTSNSQNTSRKGANMQPGIACGSCHRGIYGGTVYATGHEPDLCNGASGTAQDVSQATITIVDATGQEYPMSVFSPSGNFYLAARIATPYTARVDFMGRTRKMTTPQTSGDCNSCHTQSGRSSNGGAPAPGRITLPQ